jgi:hypothetical protein
MARSPRICAPIWMVAAATITTDSAALDLVVRLGDGVGGYASRCWRLGGLKLL